MSGQAPFHHTSQRLGTDCPKSVSGVSTGMWKGPDPLPFAPDSGVVTRELQERRAGLCIASPLVTPVTFPLRHLLPAPLGRQMCVIERQLVGASSGIPQLSCPSRRREKLGLHILGLSVQPPGDTGLWGSQPLHQEPLPYIAHCPTLKHFGVPSIH